MSSSLRSSSILHLVALGWLPRSFRDLCGMGGKRAVSITLVCVFCVVHPAHAAPKESIPTPEALAQLQQRASEAKPSEQCFLYTELVHGLTQQAAAQIAADDTGHATATILQIDQVVPLIQHNLTHDSKRVKDAELLLQDTTYRLGQMMHLLNGDDQAAIQDTLNHLNKINDELLTQVFTH
jgi:hypothetical protein